MKKVVLILVMLNSFQHLCKAQTNVYHPFPDSNAMWNILFIANCFEFGSTQENYSIEISGDTLIDSLVYHKLSTPFLEEISSSDCGSSGSPGFRGFIREDTVTRKVYYNPSGQNEYLLYDFNLEVGDTLEGWLASFNMPNTVQQIDSVLVGNNYRKRWRINDCYSIDIIEGIGCTFGLIKETVPCISDLPSYGLTCFKQEGETLYPNTTTDCELITGIETHQLNNLLYPNPATNTLTLNTDLKNAQLKVLNAQGQLVYQSAIINSQSAIDVSQLSPGIYFLSISDGTQVVSKKFVKE